jgi:16S rRNA (adenine1518-N6/adenine1519-N6)-dimethyltransferase
MKLGQVFLKNEKILKWMGSLVEGKILEIGGGDGRLTKYLKGDITVIEIDKRFQEYLKNYKVIWKDFLEVEPFEVDYIIGNVPYYISSLILFKLLDWNFKKAILMFQKEFVMKMMMNAGDRDYGRLSVMSQYYFKVRLMKIISKYNFTPIPKVDSAIIEIEKIRNKDEDFEKFVRKIFSHKNKKLKNIMNVSDEYKDIRPDQMTLDEIIKLYNSLKGPNNA